MTTPEMERLAAHLARLRPREPYAFLADCCGFLHAGRVPARFLLWHVSRLPGLAELQVAEFYFYKLFTGLQDERATTPAACNALIAHYLTLSFAGELDFLRGAVFREVCCAGDYDFVDFSTFMAKFRFLFAFGLQYNGLYDLFVRLFASKTVSDAEAALIAEIIDKGLSAREIEARCRALAPRPQTQPLSKVLAECFGISAEPADKPPKDVDDGITISSQFLLD